MRWSWLGRLDGSACQVGHNRGLSPETAAAPSTNSAAAQLDQNCCAIFGTRTVLAESPEFVDSAKRDLIVSSDRPQSCPQIELELRLGYEPIGRARRGQLLETIRSRLAQSNKRGAFCEHCSSPEKFAKQIWSSCAAADVCLRSCGRFEAVLPQPCPPSQPESCGAATVSGGKPRLCPAAIAEPSDQEFSYTETADPALRPTAHRWRRLLRR